LGQTSRAACARHQRRRADQITANPLLPQLYRAAAQGRVPARMSLLAELPDEVTLEPPRRNRKARVACNLPGCGTSIVKGRLFCEAHNRMVLARLRKENRRIYREGKAAADTEEFLMLETALRRNALACLNAVIAEAGP
jgi:hypothetical protein